MEIKEVFSFGDSELSDLGVLVSELSEKCFLSEETLEKVVSSPDTHLFAAYEDGRIIGCATLCVYCSPTGRKAAIEDVVVLSASRGKGIGRSLVEYAVSFARNIAPVELHLTSRPSRVAANKLYGSMGFTKVETNCYRLNIEK